MSEIVDLTKYRHNKQINNRVIGRCICLSCLNYWDGSYPMILRDEYEQPKDKNFKFNITIKAFLCHLCKRNTVVMLEEIFTELDTDNLIAGNNSAIHDSDIFTDKISNSINTIEELNLMLKDFLITISRTEL